jgi:hypothetical protein
MKNLKNVKAIVKDIQEDANSIHQDVAHGEITNKELLRFLEVLNNNLTDVVRIAEGKINYHID